MFNLSLIEINYMITIEEIISELGEIPLCQCGCGNKVNVNPERYNEYKRNGYPKYCLGHYKKGKQVSQETREKHRQAMLGKHWTLSDETKDKMSKAKKGKLYNPKKSKLSYSGDNCKKDPKNYCHKSSCEKWSKCYKVFFDFRAEHEQTIEKKCVGRRNHTLKVKPESPLFEFFNKV